MLKKNLPTILITLFLCILIGITILVSLEIRSRGIITNLENQLVKANEDREKLHSYLKELEDELESIDEIYRQENTLMWHSIGIMRSNFLALGLGFHLEDKDICPEEEVNCEKEIP